MNGSRFTFDTNILFYASDSTAGERHQTALILTDEAKGRDCLVMLQSLGELFNAMLKRRAKSAVEAEQIILAYRETFTIVPAIEVDLNDAILAQQQHRLPFWDAMLWATARRAGCTLILTEDLQDGRTLGGVTFRNPFKLSQPQLAELLG